MCKKCCQNRGGFVTLHCCGANSDSATDGMIHHKPTCLVGKGEAEFACSCEGPYCNQDCNGKYFLIANGQQVVLSPDGARIF